MTKDSILGTRATLFIQPPSDLEVKLGDISDDEKSAAEKIFDEAVTVAICLGTNYGKLYNYIDLAKCYKARVGAFEITYVADGEAGGEEQFKPGTPIFETVNIGSQDGTVFCAQRSRFGRKLYLFVNRQGKEAWQSAISSAYKNTPQNFDKLAELNRARYGLDFLKTITDNQ